LQVDPPCRLRRLSCSFERRGRAARIESCPPSFSEREQQLDAGGRLIVEESHCPLQQLRGRSGVAAASGAFARASEPVSGSAG
jgi:hypothetical protein